MKLKHQIQYQNRNVTKGSEITFVIHFGHLELHVPGTLTNHFKSNYITTKQSGLPIAFYSKYIAKVETEYISKGVGG